MQKCCLAGCGNDSSKGNSDYCESHRFIRDDAGLLAAYSAGQSGLHEEISLLRQALDDLGVTPSEAKAGALRSRRMVDENKRLREALEYYAASETYYIDLKNMAGLPVVCADNGAVARDALKQE